MIIFGSLIVNWVKKKKFGFFFINKIPSYEREREREREREMHTLVVTTRRVVNKKSTALKAILEKGSEISY